MRTLTCRHPDRDEPRIVCGYPLPCPWHTVLIHADKTPPTVEIPATADEALVARDKLADIAELVHRAGKEQ